MQVVDTQSPLELLANSKQGKIFEGKGDSKSSKSKQSDFGSIIELSIRDKNQQTLSDVSGKTGDLKIGKDKLKDYFKKLLKEGRIDEKQYVSLVNVLSQAHPNQPIKKLDKEIKDILQINYKQEDLTDTEKKVLNLLESLAVKPEKNSDRLYNNGQEVSNSLQEGEKKDVNFKKIEAKEVSNSQKQGRINIAEIASPSFKRDLKDETPISIRNTKENEGLASPLISKNKELRTKNQEPVIKNQELKIKKQEPVIKNQETATKNQEPVTKNQIKVDYRTKASEERLPTKKSDIPIVMKTVSQSNDEIMATEKVIIGVKDGKQPTDIHLRKDLTAGEIHDSDFNKGSKGVEGKISYKDRPNLAIKKTSDGHIKYDQSLRDNKDETRRLDTSTQIDTNEEVAKGLLRGTFEKAIVSGNQKEAGNVLATTDKKTPDNKLRDQSIIINSKSSSGKISNLNSQEGVKQTSPNYQAQETQVVDQIVKNITTSISSDKRELVVRLKPDELGTIQIKISIEGEKMKALIQTESEAIKGIVESNLNQLKNSLAEKGFNVEKFSVSVGNNFNSHSNRHGVYREFKDRFSSRKASSAEDLKIVDVDPGILKEGYYASDGYINFIA
ncbi:MAG: flagellar hook-length control protein FliK [bacterium]